MRLPGDFSTAQAAPGAAVASPYNCLRLNCGAITQEEAGLDLMAACSAAGMIGAAGCQDPACEPFRAQMAQTGRCGGGTPNVFTPLNITPASTQPLPPDAVIPATPAAPQSNALRPLPLPQATPQNMPYLSPGGEGLPWMPCLLGPWAQAHPGWALAGLVAAFWLAGTITAKR